MNISAKLGTNLFIADAPSEGRISVAQLQQRARHPRAERLWRRFRAHADNLLTQSALDVRTPFPGRSRKSAANDKVDDRLRAALDDRLAALALAYRIWGEEPFLRAAREQLLALFDRQRWPEWRDIESMPIDLRSAPTGMHAAIALDWLWQYLSDDDRIVAVEGLRERIIQPMIIVLDEERYPYHRRNNWVTCLMGGCGVVAMATADVIPEARSVLARCHERVTWVLNGYGADGEFSESPGYTDVLPTGLTYFEAYRGFTGDRERFDDQLRAVARWCVYSIEPPSKYVNHGDSGGGQFRYWWLPSVAALSRDPVLQWAYEQCADLSPKVSPKVMELIGYDPLLEPRPPSAPDWPLGMAYREHGALVSSRTDWDSSAPECIVLAKCGTEYGHEHDDAGQILIQGHGNNLIVDDMTHTYPDDYWGPDRYRYVFASARAHNLVTFGDFVPEYRFPKTVQRGRLESAWFDDRLGGWWKCDLSEPKRGIRYHRLAVHLLPGLVAVLDWVAIDHIEDITLRWHTASPSVIEPPNRFLVTLTRGALSAAVSNFCDPTALLGSGEWPVCRYVHGKGPFPFAAMTSHGSEARFVSLFAVMPATHDLPRWQPDDVMSSGRAWTIRTPTGDCRATLSNEQFSLAGASNRRIVAPIPW